MTARTFHSDTMDQEIIEGYRLMRERTTRSYQWGDFIDFFGAGAPSPDPTVDSYLETTNQ